MYSFRLRALAPLLPLALSSGFAATPAFPGAEGYGAYAVGGRGGTIYHVTNLNDSGAGSLRTGIGTANRTIVFDVSGTIDLLTDLKISKPFITIAGQTAPGDGITLKRRLTSVQDTHDVIVRFIRSRAGDIGCTNFQDDSFHCVNVTNVIIDHVSSSWSVDECLSATWSTNITVQWCVISESMKNSCHVKGAHGYGSLLRYGNGGVTYHHNLYADHDSRNPRPGDNIHLDFVNNLIYNWGGTCGYNAEDTADNLLTGFTNVLNYSSNFFLAGPSTSGHLTVAFDSGVTNSTQCQIFQSGNYIDGNKDTNYNGSDTGWAMFATPYTQLGTRFLAPQVTTDSPEGAYERVLAFAGASAARDAVDHRVVTQVRTHNGAIINSQNDVGGWPTLNSTALPVDSDNDAIPDYWELALGLNPNSTNHNHLNPDGYTDLENYLNWLAAPRAVCDPNGSRDVNLAALIGATNNFLFSVANGTNGTVSLLPDGYTARFSAVSAYSGLASFAFSAADNQTGQGLAPVTVSVLVTITNAVNNTSPALLGIPNRTLTAGQTLTFTNSASDTDQPPQTLTFSLGNAPTNASLNPGNGVFTWRPAIAQGNSTNSINVIVTDNGSPNLSATQTFQALVLSPVQPLLQAPGALSSPFGFSVTGSSGPDYLIQSSSNLTDWSTQFTTNSPQLPFYWTDPNPPIFPQRYYRVLLGP